MAYKMRRINFGCNNRSDDLLHIEVPGAIVNIRVNLHDRDGNEITHIEILPDRMDDVEFTGSTNNRIIIKKGDSE